MFGSRVELRTLSGSMNGIDEDRSMESCANAPDRKPVLIFSKLNEIDMQPDRLAIAENLVGLGPGSQ